MSRLLRLFATLGTLALLLAACANPLSTGGVQAGVSDPEVTLPPSEDQSEQTESEADSTTESADEGSEEPDVQGEARSSDAVDCTALGLGVTVLTDGSVCQDGSLVTGPPTGGDPIVLSDVDELAITSVSDSVDEDGKFQHAINFTSESSYEALCAQFVVDSIAQGFELASDDCEGRKAARLTRATDDSQAQFLTIEEKRATITFKAPSSNDVAAIVANSVPAWSNQPPANPVKFERVVSTEEFKFEVDYDNDGSFVTYCQQLQTDAEGEGFTKSTQSDCEDGGAITLSRGSSSARLTNSFEPLITYKYAVSLEG